jgi:hypothetical protein
MPYEIITLPFDNIANYIEIKRTSHFYLSFFTIG